MANFDKEFKRVWAALEGIAEDRRKEAAEREAERKKAAAEREIAAKEREIAAAERKKAAAEHEALLRKWQAEHEARRAEDAADRLRWQAEHEARMAVLNATLQKTSEQIGGFTNNYAESLEDEFAAALKEEMRVGDIRLTDVQQRVRRNKHSREYDIVGDNGDFVVVGEIKHKLLSHDVAKFAKERLPHFAADFPRRTRGRKVLGMVGGGTIVSDAKQEAKKRGLIVIRLRNKKLIAENTRGARPVAAK